MQKAPTNENEVHGISCTNASKKTGDFMGRIPEWVYT